MCGLQAHAAERSMERARGLHKRIDAQGMTTNYVGSVAQIKSIVEGIATESGLELATEEESASVVTLYDSADGRIHRDGKQYGEKDLVIQIVRRGNRCAVSIIYRLEGNLDISLPTIFHLKLARALK